MTTFLDGPAKGQVLNLQRAPRFLRVVSSTEGRQVKWDALDQLTDEPEPDEKIYAYERVGLPMRGFIDGSKYRGPFVIAQYKLITPHPDEIDLRLNDRWADWARAHAPASVPFTEPNQS